MAEVTSKDQLVSEWRALWTFVRNRLKAGLQNASWVCDVVERKRLCDCPGGDALKCGGPKIQYGIVSLLRLVAVQQRREPVPQEQGNFGLRHISHWFGVRTKGLLRKQTERSRNL